MGLLVLFLKGELYMRKIIAVDFDGTLCENKWPEIGEPNEEVIEYVKSRQKAGAAIILWTCRVGEKLADALFWCAGKDLYFDAINENHPDTLKWMGTDSRKIFAHEYIDDRNKLVRQCREKSNMEKWAKKEVEIACKREAPDRKDGEWDYGCACYESALKAFESLCDDGHSGLSIGFTKTILNRLIDRHCLTPIEDTEDVWDERRYSPEGDARHYQCKRMSSVFKDVFKDGTVKYSDVDRYIGIDVGNDWGYRSGLIDRIGEEMFPITFPYCPCDAPFKFHTETFLMNPKNGDFDTSAVLYVVTPDNERIGINRYFKDSDDGYEEIDFEEYHRRRQIAEFRVKNGLIDDVDEDWTDVSAFLGVDVHHFQHKKAPNLFKTIYVNGDVTFKDVNRKIVVKENGNEYTDDDILKLVRDVVDTFCPIVFPYAPEDGVFIVNAGHVKRFTSEIFVSSIETPNGHRINVKKWFRK